MDKLINKINKLIIGLIGVGAVLLAVGIPFSIYPLIAAGVAFLAAGILLVYYK